MMVGMSRSRRSPALLGHDRLLVPFSREKTHGLETLGVDGKEHRTLSEGTAFYRNVAPSPDGRFLAATFSFDLSADATQLMRIRQNEELHLLDADGAFVARLAHSPVHSYHSPAWAPTAP